MTTLGTAHDFFVYTFASVVSIANPIGMSPIFVSMTQGYSRRVQHQIAYRVAGYSLILLIAALYLGPPLLRFFGITLPFIQISGGWLVIISALGMLDTKPKISHREAEEALSHAEVAFFPLTMPITAGAGALAITIAIASTLSRLPPEAKPSMYLATLAGLAAVCVVVAVCYRFAATILGWLGETGANVITRLSAFILLAIGLGVVWSGLSVLILSLHFN